MVNRGLMAFGFLGFAYLGFTLAMNRYGELSFLGIYIVGYLGIASAFAVGYHVGKQKYSN